MCVCVCLGGSLSDRGRLYLGVIQGEQEELGALAGPYGGHHREVLGEHGV